MIADLTLRWVVTMLFVVNAFECLLTLVVARHHRAVAIGHGFHLVMAVVMAVMAWPRGAALPTTGPAAFFLFAAIWFVAVALLVATGTASRLVNGYHAVMMLAMAWMYAAMNGSLLPGQGPAGGSGTAGQGGHAGHAGHGGGGADQPAPDVHAGHTAVAEPGYIWALNWFWTLLFAVAAVFWLYRCFVTRRDGAGPLTLQHFGTVCQAMMAAGMAVMFGVML